MSEESWRRPAFLQTLLVSLDAEIFTRYQQFLKAAKAGGGDARNRRRKACGRELLSGILETLVISADSALRSGDRARKQDCDSLAGIVRERLAEVEASSFVWTKSIPLVPDIEFETVLESAYQAAEPAWDELSEPLEPASSSHRSRSPAARSLDIPSGFERVAVTPAPRPRIEGCPTPIPPTPRPVISGQKTPLPPRARSKESKLSIPSQTSGPSRAAHVEIVPPVGFSEPSSSSTAVSAVPAATIVVPDEEDPAAEASASTELCVLYPANDLWPVINWSAEAIRQGYRRLITLDEHKVADRDITQTTVLVRTALSKGVAIAVLSYIPDSSFASHGQTALDLWRGILSSIDFPLELAPLPIIVTSKPKGPAGKASTIRYVRNHLFWSHELEFRDWTHIDDRGDIVAEINSDRFLRAICWDPRDRRSLLKLCQDNQLL